MENELRCKIYPANKLQNLKFVVVCSYYNGKWMLSKHKKRNTWETQGGHIEKAESPLDAAKRELFEESGVTNAEIYHVCDYIGYNSSESSNGAVFFAHVYNIGELPESEMEAVALFDTLPYNLTYPHVTPHLMEKAEIYAIEHKLIKEALQK